MTIHRVRATGIDSGSVGPFKTFEYAQSQAVNGDTVRIEGGYSVTAANQLINVTKSITLESEDDSYINGNMLWPAPTTTPTAGDPYTTTALVRVNANNARVRHLEIGNTPGSGVGCNTGTGTKQGCIFEDLYIHDLRWQAFGVDATNYAEARRIRCDNGGLYLQVTRPASGPDGSNWPGMFKWANSSYGYIEDVEISRNWGEGMAFPNSPFTTVYGAEIYQCYSAHCYFNHATDINVRKLLIYHTGTSHLRGGTIANGLAFNNEDATKQAAWPDTARVRVSDFLIVGLGPCINFGDQKRSGMTDIKIYNGTLIEGREFTSTSSAIDFANTSYFDIEFYNLLVYQTLGDYVTGAAGATGITWHNNLWYGLGMPPAAIRGTGDIYTNPLLVNPIIPPVVGVINLDNYQIGLGSPAINAGTATSTRTTDYNGWPLTGLPEIGAFEYGSRVPDPEPPVPGNSFVTLETITEFKSANNTTVTFSHTHPDDIVNDILVLIIHGQRVQTGNTFWNVTTPPTYGGVAMTQINYVGGSMTNTNTLVSVWYLVNPTPGSATVSVTATTNVQRWILEAASFSGVDQTTPTVFISGTNTGAPFADTETIPDRSMLWLAVTANGTATAPTPGTGNTLQYSSLQNPTVLATNVLGASVYRRYDPGGTVTLTVDVGPENNLAPAWMMFAINATPEPVDPEGIASTVTFGDALVRVLGVQDITVTGIANPAALGSGTEITTGAVEIAATGLANPMTMGEGTRIAVFGAGGAVVLFVLEPRPFTFVLGELDE